MKYRHWLSLVCTSLILGLTGTPATAGISTGNSLLAMVGNLSLNADNANDFYVRGSTKYQAGDLPGALQDFEEALKLQPDLVEALVNSANILDDFGKTAEAIERYGLALAQSKSDPNIYYNRGLAYGRLQQYPKAISDYNKAIAIDPAYAPPYAGRAILKYEKMNDKKGGLADLKVAAEIYKKQGNQEKFTELMQLYAKLGR
jgi:tetratricopeptide (TPR) repeat protein